MRVAIYCRVSTEEQALHGFSIETQKDQLTKYANDNNFIIVDYYLDYGFSGGTIKRPQLERLMNDVKHQKIDTILFTRLDRWFRSVPLYYEIQKILEENHVNWICTEEDYETTTSHGKFKVNIMLSVSQQYKDTTSEKIKDIIAHKVSQGYYPSGKVPYGFTLKREEGGVKVVIDETKKDIVLEVYHIFERTMSKRGTVIEINALHNIKLSSRMIGEMITNSLYYGEYKGIENFNEPYISKEYALHLQDIANKHIRHSLTNRVYIFTGLIKCPICGSTMVGWNKKQKVKKPTSKSTYKLYMCHNHNQTNSCTNARRPYEQTIERDLLNALQPQFEQYCFEIKKGNEKKRSKNITKEEILKELDRLNTMFQKGRINEEKYDKEYDKLKNALNLCDKQPKSTERLENILNTNVAEFYATLSDKEKRLFWSTIAEKIELDENCRFKKIWFK